MPTKPAQAAPRQRSRQREMGRGRAQYRPGSASYRASESRKARAVVPFRPGRIEPSPASRPGGFASPDRAFAIGGRTFGRLGASRDDDRWHGLLRSCDRTMSLAVIPGCILPLRFDAHGFGHFQPRRAAREDIGDLHDQREGEAAQLAVVVDVHFVGEHEHSGLDVAESPAAPRRSSPRTRVRTH